MKYLLPLLLAGASVPAPVLAQHGASPYAGQEDRAIKALAPETVAGLRRAEGMGLAKAAELNGWPGPRHVLDLAEELELTPVQERRARELFEAMRTEAVRLGEAIIERERALDRAFAGSTVADRELTRRTAEIARLWGELRTVHLRAHLAMRQVLDPAQVRRYAELRGYDGRAHHRGGVHDRDDPDGHPGLRESEGGEPGA